MIIFSSFTSHSFCGIHKYSKHHRNVYFLQVSLWRCTQISNFLFKIASTHLEAWNMKLLIEVSYRNQKLVLLLNPASLR